MILEGRERAGDWYILRNCLNYESDVSFFGNVLEVRRKKFARYVVDHFWNAPECPRVMFRGTRKEAYPEDAYPEMQHVPDT